MGLLAGDLMSVCPECDVSDIRKRTHKPCGARDVEDGDYYCNQCSHHFDEPAVRERQSTGGNSGPSKMLLDADPDVEFPDGDDSHQRFYQTERAEGPRR